MNRFLLLSFSIHVAVVSALFWQRSATRLDERLPVEVSFYEKTQPATPPRKSAAVFRQPTFKETAQNDIATETSVQESGQTDSATQASGSPDGRRYLAELRSFLEQAKVYPLIARRLHQQGEVKVSFTIKKDGRIEGVQLASSSGHQNLDNAAIEFLRKLKAFKPLTDDLGREEWPLTLPISYSLQSE